MNLEENMLVQIKPTFFVPSRQHRNLAFFQQSKKLNFGYQLRALPDKENQIEFGEGGATSSPPLSPLNFEKNISDIFPENKKTNSFDVSQSFLSHKMRYPGQTKIRDFGQRKNLQKEKPDQFRKIENQTVQNTELKKILQSEISVFESLGNNAEFSLTGRSTNASTELISNLRSRNILRFIFILFTQKGNSPPRGDNQESFLISNNTNFELPESASKKFQTQKYSERKGATRKALKMEKIRPRIQRFMRSNLSLTSVTQQIGLSNSAQYFLFILFPFLFFYGILKSTFYLKGLENTTILFETQKALSLNPNSKSIDFSCQNFNENRGSRTQNLESGFTLQAFGSLYGNFDSFIFKNAQTSVQKSQNNSKLVNSNGSGGTPQQNLKDWFSESQGQTRKAKEYLEIILKANFFQENLYRLPDYTAKIFLIWGLLYVWKGVRPQRKLFKDLAESPLEGTRIVWPTKPSGGLRRFLQNTKTTNRSMSQNSQKSDTLSNLQGITAYRPILENLIYSLEISKTRGNPLKFFLQSTQKLKASKNINFQLYPKGYLFVGPPGTGKTLLAQAIAQEAKVPLLCLSASEVQKQIEIGTRIGALRLRKLFSQARRLAPCVLFLDEIDAIGKYRGSGSGFPKVSDNFMSGNSGLNLRSHLESVDNQNTSADTSTDLKLFTEFLIQMDSFPSPGQPGGFVVIGTTNFLNNLDSAFIRSGRFDRILGLNYPSKKVRIDILQYYCEKSSLISENFKKPGGSYTRTLGENSTKLSEQQIPWNYFSYYTQGLSPADLARLVNEAILYSTGAESKFPKLSGTRKSQTKELHTFESLQKGFNRIQSHRRNLYRDK